MGKEYNHIFMRVEKKYLLTPEQHDLLLERWAEYINSAPFAHSRISNIYFDTKDDLLIRKSLDKPCYKEKLRLRAYGDVTPDSDSFVELKKKYKGIVYKRRMMLPLKNARQFLEDRVMPEESSQILREIDYCMRRYHLVPRLFIRYERDSYQAIQDSNIRITFDTNIESRRQDLQLEKNLRGEPLSEKDFWIMEIKVPLAYPLWLSRSLTELKIFPTSFSKYGQIYKKEKTQGVALT